MNEFAQAIEVPPQAPVPAAALVPLPGPIVLAIAGVMKAMGAVKKSQKNTHGGYSYASTDDIYAEITKKMGEVGLICLALEEEQEIKEHKAADGKPSRWLKATFTFILATQEATWTDARCRRTVMVQITGPQTFQAAQSYCEKSFLRSTFKIPTGDMDLDALPEDFSFNPIGFKTAPTPPPAAPAEKVPAGQVAGGRPNSAPEQSLADDAAVLREATQGSGEGARASKPASPEPKAEEKPRPNMRGALAHLAATLGGLTTLNAVDDAIADFEERYDGHITQSVETELESMRRGTMQRLGMITRESRKK